MFNLAAPPGFRGLDPNKPVVFYARHLPHWRQDGATYFVTFRLGDSLPQAKLRELRIIRADWEKHHRASPSEHAWQALARATAERVERWLDQGMGACWLKEPSIAKHVISAMHHFDGTRYELGCYVVMPNHVHVLVRPTDCRQHSLEDIVGSWKQYSARRIGASLDTDGDLWQHESFDRIVRDEEHLYRALQYIGRNPELAGLSPGQYLLWLRPEWEAFGWRFEARVG